MMASAARLAYTPLGSQTYLYCEVGRAWRVEITTALQEAFVAHRSQLLRFLRARGAADEAEDLLQEIWLRLSGAEPGEVQNARSYMYQIAHNLILDNRRGAVRRRLREEKYHQAIDGREAAPNAEHVLIARDKLRHVNDVLAALGPKADYVFRRHRVEGVAQRDIAAELGVTLSTVEKHLQRAYRAVAAFQVEQAADAPVILREVRNDRR